MLNIMVIDEQPLLAKWLDEDLSGKKYNILHTDNIDDIEDDVKAMIPDIILLDISFDGFERWDVLNWIKQEIPHIPVLLMGFYDSVADDARSSKANGFIVKDIYRDKIKNKVKELCL
jgi:DNA-binding NtrC family response regulator